ncbi:MAG: hypothetical protein ACPGU7_08545 [Gammaproteobacteria bacterium]
MTAETENPVERYYLDAYQAMVDELAENRLPRIVSNGEPGHARILVTALFRFAVKTVRIFSTKLGNQIYNDRALQRAVKRFLDKPGTKLVILLQDPDSTNNGGPTSGSFVSILDEYGPDKVEMRRVVDDRDGPDSDTPHMVIQDAQAWRWCDDPSQHSAIASFNQPERAARAAYAFDKMFQRAEPFRFPEMTANKAA